MMNKNCPVLRSIIWNQLATCPDLSFSVSLLSQFQADPGVEHWKACNIFPLTFIEKIKHIDFHHHYVCELVKSRAWLGHGRTGRNEKMTGHRHRPTDRHLDRHILAYMWCKFEAHLCRNNWQKNSNTFMAWADMQK